MASIPELNFGHINRWKMRAHNFAMTQPQVENSPWRTFKATETNEYSTYTKQTFNYPNGFTSLVDIIT